MTDVRDDPRKWGFDDHNAVFFNWHLTTPTYHGFDWDLRRDDGPVSRDKTRCGLVVAEYNSETKRLREPGSWLPLKHAVKFGKPCRKCFPTEPAKGARCTR